MATEGGGDVPVGVISASTRRRQVEVEKAVGSLDSEPTGEVEPAIAGVGVRRPDAGMDPVDDSHQLALSPQGVAGVVVAMDEAPLRPARRVAEGLDRTRPDLRAARGSRRTRLSELVRVVLRYPRVERRRRRVNRRK